MELKPSSKTLRELNKRQAAHDKTMAERNAANEERAEADRQREARRKQLRRIRGLTDKLTSDNVSVDENTPEPNLGWVTVPGAEDMGASLQARIFKSKIKTYDPSGVVVATGVRYSLQARFASQDVATAPSEVLALDNIKDRGSNDGKSYIGVHGVLGLNRGGVDFTLESDIDPAAVNQLLEIERVLLDPIVEATLPARGQ